MKKTYTFRHFILGDEGKKSIDPSEINSIKDRCKLFITNMATGKEYEIVKKEA